MPEGPELCMNSRFVNNVCRGRLFTGKIVKSAVSKCPDVDFSSEAYVISSESRGKEMALTLQCSAEPLNRLRLLFRFGMSGKFKFTPMNQIPKHAHLQFFSRPSDADAASEQKLVLSFVDVRRFGSWRVMPEGWGENRGPDPMFEYEAFRANVLENLEDSAFNRPICEAMLNQKFFNGIGNYLRAEILYRASVAPFTCARKVLEPLAKQEHEEDLLSLCHTVPKEVVDLKQTLGKSETAVVTEEDYRAFCQWLKCYENPAMNTAKDHNGRTIWFKVTWERLVQCVLNQNSSRGRDIENRVLLGLKCTALSQSRLKEKKMRLKKQVEPAAKKAKIPTKGATAKAKKPITVPTRRSARLKVRWFNL
ncbi:Endonuclease 8-like 1 [Geodia barretti]|uniref:DNA-(apurinic or apyrimidinic site) lyase n=1 Tax=Geodia barretti TaxID=519541 RepID=A0AA35W3S1_GEOBA|nr:Endonuclease 8-like 1 [Geodia barretti]